MDICPACKRKMVLNFNLFTCEWCRGDIRDLPLHHGYVVMTDERMHKPHYVFRTPGDAKRWKDHYRLDGAPVTKVLSPTAFRWQESRGALTGLEIANRLYEVVDDHKFDPRDSKVFRAPPGFRSRRTVHTVRRRRS